MTLIKTDARSVLSARLMAEDGDGLAAESFGALATIADADGADLAIFREPADEVKNHAVLGSGVEVQPVVDGDVYEVFG